MSTSGGYSITVRTRLGFEEAIEAVTAALKEQGFGILTEIDVKATMKQKLDIDVAPYRILGACNPPLAHRALQIDPEVGLLLPCNVVVRAEDGDTVVSIMDPGIIARVADNPDLVEVAAEARVRLEKVAAALAG
jgi:uncharacterized protein (DUF302 family)